MSTRAERGFHGMEQFSLLRQLGQGSYGIVYEAFDRKRNRIIALKTLSRAHPTSLARFKREFRALSDILHPNLVMLYELLSDREQWFFTMELLNGVHLLQSIREETVAVPLPPDSSTLGDLDFSNTPTIGNPPSSAFLSTQSAPIHPAAVNYDRLRNTFAQLSEGIGALHEAGLLHRDIKPSNVMVTNEGRVVLLDFGLVAEMSPEDTLASLNIVGTPAYMSPEQAIGEQVTESSDLYSVGVMLYQALTGRLPFAGSILEILSAKKEMEPPPPSSRLPGIPPDLNDLCSDMLRRDPQRRPNLHDIITRLGGPKTPPRKRTVSRTRPGRILIGREHHLRALEEAYVDAHNGRSVTVYVQGHSGMGKTALVNRFLADIQERDQAAVVLTGCCYERESVPYKAVDSLIDSLAQHFMKLPEAETARLLPRHIFALTRLFPVLRDVPAMLARQRVEDIQDSQELRRRAFAALRELLGRMADTGPVVLYIDDLQWGDVDSGALLEELIRPPDAPAVLLVASYRSEEAGTSPLLQRLMAFRARTGSGMDVRDLPVGELTFDEACAVALALIGPNDPDLLESARPIARESMGSPFFVDELARYHREKRVGGAATLEELIRQRVSQLPLDARQLLEAVAVAGQPVDRQVAREAAKLEGDDHAAVGLLRAGHFVRVSSADQMETYHDRIRESVARSLVPDALGELHHRLALAWEKVNADPETLAIHFHAAGNNDRAAHYAAIAAERSAEALAFDRAARFYRLALDLRPEQNGSARGLWIALGDALANAGRGAEAAHAYQAAARHADPALAIDLERRAAEQLLFGGHIDEGRAAAGAVLARFGMRLPKTPRKALLSLLYHRLLLRLRGLKFRERTSEKIPPDQLLRIDTCRSLALVLGLYDVITGTDYHSRNLLLALQAGEPNRVARALAPELAYSALKGARSHARTEKLQRILDGLISRTQSPHAVGLSQLYMGIVAFLEARFADGGELLEQAESIFREKCTGAICELDTSFIFWMFCLIQMGEWRKLNRRWPALLKDAEERGDLYAAVALRGRMLYLSYLVADDIEAARQHEREVRSHLPSGKFESPHLWTWFARVEIALYAGQARDAWDEVEKQWGAFAGSLLPRVQELYIDFHQLRARCAIAVGRFDEAEREARLIERERSIWGNGMAGTIRAGLAAVRGDRRKALETAASTERIFVSLKIQHYRAALQRRCGELLGGEEGRALVESADARMTEQDVRNPQRMTALLLPWGT